MKIINQLLRIVSLLVALALLSFWLISYSPIDPIQAYIGADLLLVGPEQRELITEYWGLNQPPLERFLHWASAVAQGDLGTSMIFRRPVGEIIGEKFMASLALMSSAWLFSGLFGFVLGTIAALKQHTWLDRLIRLYCFTLAATPTFWLGLLLLYVFVVWLGWFPLGLGVPIGKLAEEVTLSDRLYHLILPALTLSILGVVNVALHTRQKLIDVWASEHILFARARGISEGLLFWRHGLRHVVLPAITIQFASFGELFGGVVLAEQIFAYPGLGQATVQAGLRGDVPLLLGIVLVSSLFVCFGNLLADVLYQLIDPRIRKRHRV